MHAISRVADGTVAWVVAGLASIAISLISSPLLSADVGDMQTRNMIRLALVWYAVALGLMMRLGAEDWRAETGLGRAAGSCWTWACGCFLIHLGMAFHYFHHWSHTHAFEHTRAVSGLGEGIYASYLFTAVWVADVAGWWLTPQWYARRSRWIDGALHAFMLFIVFNGTVIFESGPIRWAGAAGFAVVAVLWLMSGRRLAISN